MILMNMLCGIILSICITNAKPFEDGPSFRLRSGKQTMKVVTRLLGMELVWCLSSQATTRWKSSAGFLSHKATSNNLLQDCLVSSPN